MGTQKVYCLFMKAPYPLLAAAVVCVLTTVPCPADQVEMQNGDRYNGKVLSLDDKSLILQNDLLGKITLPRGRISAVLLGTQPAGAVSNSFPRPQALKQTNAFTAQLASNTNLIQQVQQKFLAGAEPVAQQKFNQLVSGLLDGSISVEDVQREAKSAADQARALRKELGPDAGFALDGYLAILDQFLKEAQPGPEPTNSIPAKRRDPMP